LLEQINGTLYLQIGLYHQIAQTFDAKTQTCVVFCDISKTFDRVWHTGLIFKLKQQGVPETNLCAYCNVPENVPSFLTIAYNCFTALAISIP